AVLDAHAHRHDRGFAAFEDGAVVAGLAALGIEVPALNVAERGDALPNASAGRNVDRILGLAESDDERRLARVVRDDRLQVAIERRTKAVAIARGLRGCDLVVADGGESG